MTQVCVLMTVYNHEAFVAEAIESVLAQTFQHWELIILDDCSTDRSPDIARKYAIQDSRVTFIPGSENLGQACLLNQHLPQYQSKYVAFLDSDDYWLPGKLERQIALLERSPEVAVVHTDGFMVDSRSSEQMVQQRGAWPADVQGKRFSDLHHTPSNREGWVFEELLKASFIFFSSAMIRRDYLQNVKFRIQVKRSIDWYFFIDLSKLCEFAYIEEPLAAYRIHGKNRQDIVFGTEEMVAPRKFVLDTYGEYMSRVTRAKHLKHIGNSYYYLSDKKRALAYLKQSLMLNPLDTFTWGYLWRTLVKRQKPAKS